MKLKYLLLGMSSLATLHMFCGPALAQDSKITLLTWNVPVYEEQIRGWTEEFNAIHPDIEVEWIDKKGTEWPTFYQTQVAAGTPPDVIDAAGSLWVEYAADERLLDLTPYLDADPDFRNRFTQGALDLWTMDGKTYMVPWYSAKTLLFINKRMLDEAGLSGPPQTFDQILEYAEKMKGEGQTGFLTTNFDWLFWPLFKMNGVEVLNEDMTKAAFNTEAGVRTLTALAEATASGAINNISWTGRWVEPNTAFAAGNVGMYMAPSSALFWAASNSDWIDKDSVVVSNPPQDWAVFQVHGLGISSDTAHADAAVDLIKIATTDKWQTVMGDTFSALTLNANVDRALIDRFAAEDPLKGATLELAASGFDKSTGALRTPLDSQIKDIFWAEVQPALLGQRDPAEALAAAEEKINRVLARR